jgi:succinate-semialdehyde dehydrogenase/glutarate-semialdehyde dehydrogenase
LSKQVVTVNPATDEVIESFDAMEWDEVSSLMSSAVEAQAAWRHSELGERSDKLRKLGQILRDEVEHHATLISREMGKPISEARGEVLKCALACDRQLS